MKRVLFACALLLVLSLMGARAHADTLTGSWNAQAGNNASTVHLRLDFRRVSAGGDEEWDESRDVPVSELRGVNASDFASRGERKSFIIVRDAGEMRAEGWFASGNAAGTWTFAPNPNFAAELARRGVGAPSEKQQFELTMSDFKLATLDALLGSGFERPTVDDLVAMTQHGVTGDYIAGVKNIPLKPKSVRELIRMRDHGVDAQYAAQMTNYLPGMTSDDLIRMRDHGVDAQYVARMRSYLPGVTSGELVRLRDHGVTVSFTERMRNHGYTHLSAEDLIRLRDHGF